MTEAVIYHHYHKILTVHFAHRGAKLPVRLANGEIKLAPWGRRQHENSEMPLGGWARLENIHAGKWSQYSPKPVRLPIQRFMKTDYENHIHWYDLMKGQYVQGLLAKLHHEFRVYIVTITPERLDIEHDRWPRILASPV